MNDVRMKKVERIIKSLDDLNYQLMELQEEEEAILKRGGSLNETLYARFSDGSIWSSPDYLDWVLLQFDTVIKNLKKFPRAWKV